MVSWEKQIFTSGCVPFEAGSHMMRGKCKFSHEDVFPLMREALWWRGKCKFSLKDVFPLMWESMWWRGKCKFYLKICSV